MNDLAVPVAPLNVTSTVLSGEPVTVRFVPRRLLPGRWSAASTVPAIRRSIPGASAVRLTNTAL